MVQSHPVLRPQECADLRVEDPAHHKKPLTLWILRCAFNTQERTTDMMIFLTCFFAGAWGHSLYVQSRQARELERLRSKLWANGLEA